MKIKHLITTLGMLYLRFKVVLVGIRQRDNLTDKQAYNQTKKVPYIVTHDGRTIRYPDPLVKVNDSV